MALEDDRARGERPSRSQRPVVGVDVAEMNLALADTPCFGDEIGSSILEVDANTSAGTFERHAHAQESGTEDGD